MTAQQRQLYVLSAHLVSGINVTKTGLQVLALTIPKKLSPKGDQDTGLQWQVFHPIEQVNSTKLLVNIIEHSRARQIEGRCCNLVYVGSGWGFEKALRESNKQRVCLERRLSSETFAQCAGNTCVSQVIQSRLSYALVT